MIEIYFNEESIHEQFYDRASIHSALRIFLSVLNLIGEISAERRFFRKNDPLQFSKAARGEYLIATINRVTDLSLKQAIFGAWYNRLKAINWADERLHSSADFFTCAADDVTETSMAELAERTFCNATRVATLLNFPKSRYAKQDTVCITKNRSRACDLRCVDEEPSMAAWLNDVLSLRDFAYDYHSLQPPVDEQTVLRDHRRFVRTNQVNGGRKVYKEVGTNYYWYADNLHFGQSAHLEVFDPDGIHLGEADIEGVLDETKKDPFKRLAV
jgi:hypothetical protein